MNRDALGAPAETIGAAGVIVSLVYLTFQVRQNTRAIRAQTYDWFVSRFRNWNEPMRTDRRTAGRGGCPRRFGEAGKTLFGPA